MPCDFPDMNSLKRSAKLWKFREPEPDEREDSYRQALANFVEPKDFVESQEIRNKVGWDKFTDEQNSEMLLMACLRNRRR